MYDGPGYDPAAQQFAGIPAQPRDPVPFPEGHSGPLPATDQQPDTVFGTAYPPFMQQAGAPPQSNARDPLEALRPDEMLEILRALRQNPDMAAQLRVGLPVSVPPTPAVGSQRLAGGPINVDQQLVEAKQMVLMLRQVDIPKLLDVAEHLINITAHFQNSASGQRLTFKQSAALVGRVFRFINENSVDDVQSLLLAGRK